jgi:hypothetical protein
MEYSENSHYGTSPATLAVLPRRNRPNAIWQHGPMRRTRRATASGARPGRPLAARHTCAQDELNRRLADANAAHAAAEARRAAVTAPRVVLKINRNNERY